MMDSVFQKYKNDAKFLCIYIAEAHPADEWYLYTIGACIKQPKTLEERISVATKYQNEFKLPFPLTVDYMDNAAELAYAAWPERLYVIQDNHIVFKSNRGPYGYHPEQIEEWLEAYTKLKK